MVFAGAAYAGNGNDGDNQNGAGCEENCGNGGGQGGDGGVGGAGGSSTAVQGNVQVTGTYYEDAKNPASGAANLYLSTCTSGASAQVFGGGGSLGGPDVVCSLLNLAQVSAVLGDEEGALEALHKAQRIMAVRTNPVLTVLQSIPILRHLF